MIWRNSAPYMETTEKSSPFVLVSRGCSAIPPDDWTQSALEEHLDTAAVVDKLWYFLSDEGDLFIIKLAASSGPAHGAAVAKVTGRMGTYAEQYDQHGDAFDVISDGILHMSDAGMVVANVGGGRRDAGGRAAPDGVLQLATHPAQGNPPARICGHPLLWSK